MRRVPLILRVAVVCSSLTLLLGFVAMKAGALGDRGDAASPEPTTVMMPGTKSAPVEFDSRSFVTTDGASGRPIPEEVKSVDMSPRDIHAFSSKSAVPLVEPTIPPIILQEDAQGTLMPSTKRAEVFDSTFPAKPTSVAPAAPPVTLPSTKSMAPAIDFTPPPPPLKAIPPQTLKGKGY